MESKLLFLDLDGTLLNDAKEISDGNRTALDKALSLGHRVVICTGRPLCSAIDMSKRLGLTGEGCYVIAYNGGAVYDVYRGEMLFEQTVPAQAACAVGRRAQELNLHVQTYDNTHVLVNPRCEDELLAQYCKTIRIPYRLVPEYPETLSHNPPKVLVIAENHAVGEILEKEINTRFSQDLECFFSNPRFLEIVPRGMNKGNAIRRMCARIGIPVERSIAVGDADNDLSMIQAAGLGVCMRNGTPAMKAAADYITENDNNHDGVAEVVEKFMVDERGIYLG